MRADGRTRGARVPQQDTTPTASRASLPVLARRFRADLHGIRLFEGLEPDSWESRPAPWWTCPALTESPQLVDVDGLDRGPAAGGRGRPRPSVPSWPTWTALTESPQLVDVDGLDRGPAAGGRGRPRPRSLQLVDVDGLDRVSPAGRRGRPRPRVLSWWTCPALTECPQLVDVDGLDRESPAGRRGRGRVPRRV